MLPAAEKPIPALTSSEEIFSLAADVALAALDTHQGAHEAEGKKTHQGIFSKNRALRVGEIWVKYSGTHQDRKRSWSKTVSGSALDANGNTLNDPSGRSFSWDFENRLTQAVVPGQNGGTTTFRYDPFGRRIQKSGPLGTTNLLYSGVSIVEEVDGSGNVLARYTQGKRVDEPLAELRQGTTSYYEQDGLGSVTSLSNSSGALANTYAYDSFGKLTASTGTITNPFQYAGRESDQETGIYYNRARYLDQNAGRFVSADPIRFRGGTNFYAYTRNNPVLLTDAFGYQGCTPGQWAQSPNACAGPQDPNAPYQGPDGLWYNTPEWHPDPTPPPPSPVPTPTPLPNPNTCDHANPGHPKGDCTAAWGETAAGIGGILVDVVFIWYVGPELAEEEFGGGMDWLHLGPALAPGPVLYLHGLMDITEDCQ
jgi:RHS repeat-associated protein